MFNGRWDSAKFSDVAGVWYPLFQTFKCLEGKANAMASLHYWLGTSQHRWILNVMSSWTSTAAVFRLIFIVHSLLTSIHTLFSVWLVNWFANWSLLWHDAKCFCCNNYVWLIPQTCCSCSFILTSTLQSPGDVNKAQRVAHLQIGSDKIHTQHRQAVINLTDSSDVEYRLI